MPRIELIKKKRGAARSSLGKVLDGLKQELEKGVPDPTKIAAEIKVAETWMDKVKVLDAEVAGLMLENDDTTEEEFGAEDAKILELDSNYQLVVTEAIGKVTAQDEDKISNYTSASTRVPGGSRSYRLPKLELKPFCGDPKRWLWFWSQFKGIHEDNDLPEEKKFQYLIQATKEGSNARRVVESFAPSAENYEKAIKYLEERFGRKETLVEVYVRGLLEIVLKERKSEDGSLAQLYDDIETQLRSLESLGITADKYGAMLFPLVESALPEDILRAWERNRLFASEDKKKDKLRHLMDFLKQEVDGEERVKLAQRFGKASSSSQEEPSRQYKKKGIATTTDLFSSSSDKKKCVFCDRRDHPSYKCEKGLEMSVEDRRKCVEDKKGCYLCFGIGHPGWECKTKNYCRHCNKAHDSLLCFKPAGNARGTGLNQQDRTDAEISEGHSEEESDSEKKADQSLANYTRMEGVVLQTLMVDVAYGGRTTRVRAIMDTGSVHSYITKKIAAVLELPKKEKIGLSHGLFGGMETKEIKHNVYHVKVSAVVGRFSVRLKLLDQEQICSSVARVPEGKWRKEFEEKGIQFTDTGTDCPDIELLIGADIAGELYTGQMYTSKEGQVAMQTKLGWTVMGEVKGWQGQNANFLISLLDRDLTSGVATVGVKQAQVQEATGIELSRGKDPREFLDESLSRDESSRENLMAMQNKMKTWKSQRKKLDLPEIDYVGKIMQFGMKK